MESYFVIQKNTICFHKICPRLVSVSYLSKKNINTGHLRVWPEVVNENKRNLNKLSLFIFGALKNEKRIYLKGSNPRRRRQRGCGKTKETKEQSLGSSILILKFSRNGNHYFPFVASCDISKAFGNSNSYYFCSPGCHFKMLSYFKYILNFPCVLLPSVYYKQFKSLA